MGKAFNYLGYERSMQIIRPRKHIFQRGKTHWYRNIGWKKDREHKPDTGFKNMLNRGFRFIGKKLLHRRNA